MNANVLQETISNLIDSKKEGDYWDFKQQYPTNNARFIRDIICLGNNTTGNDGLLIFGVEDGTHQVLGIESDLNRKKQADILDLLNNGCKFDGSCPSIELHTIIKPSFEISLISDDENIAEKTYSYKPPKKLANRNPLWRISEEELQVNPTLSWKNATLGDMEKGKSFGNIAGGITEDDDLTDEEIEEYNSKLPSQEEVDKYNLKQTLYENAQNNCFNFFLEIENVGKAEANNIDMRLFFPEGLLLYYKDEIKDIREPDALEFPDFPIFKKMYSAIKNIAPPSISRMTTMGIAANYSFPKSSPNFTAAMLRKFDFNVPSKPFYIDDDNSALELKLPNLLHTRDFCSNEFSVIATKSGAFKIEYDIICKELIEPQTGEFVLNIVQDNNNP